MISSEVPDYYDFFCSTWLLWFLPESLITMISPEVPDYYDFSRCIYDLSFFFSASALASSVSCILIKSSTCAEGKIVINVLLFSLVNVAISTVITEGSVQ